MHSFFMLTFFITRCFKLEKHTHIHTHTHTHTHSFAHTHTHKIDKEALSPFMFGVVSLPP